MRRANYAMRRVSAVNRSRRRRIFMKEVRQRRQARQEVFFLQQKDQ